MMVLKYLSNSAHVSRVAMRLTRAVAVEECQQIYQIDKSFKFSTE